MKKVLCFAVLAAGLAIVGPDAAFGQPSGPSTPPSVAAPGTVDVIDWTTLEWRKGPPPAAQPQDVSADTSASPAPRDEAFERLVDLSLVPKAIERHDAGLLCDVALTLAEGERVLLRKHASASSETMLKLALRMAVEGGDKATLDRLARAAERQGNKELLAQIALSRKMAMPSRAPDSSRMISVSGLDDEQAARCQQLFLDIQQARLSRDTAEIGLLRQFLQDAYEGDLPRPQQAGLLKLLEECATEVQRLGPAAKPDAALSKLMDYSRALTASMYDAGRTQWLYPHGWFNEFDPKKWAERNNAGQYKFREIVRNRNYVELYDANRRMHVRLFAKKMFWRTPDRSGWNFLYEGSWADPARLPMNPRRLPNERGRVDTTQVRVDFPHLGHVYEVLGPATKTYNCIAWSLGITTRWVWPGARVADFDTLNGRFGYKRISQLDYRRHVALDKIVLYAQVSPGRDPVATHQARQLADGSWSSKLGALPLIRHYRPDDLDGKAYGVPVAVYVKQRKK